MRFIVYSTLVIFGLGFIVRQDTIYCITVAATALIVVVVDVFTKETNT